MNLNNFEVKYNCYIEFYDNNKSFYYLTIGFDKTTEREITNTFFNDLLNIFGANKYIIKAIGNDIISIQLLKTVETIG